MNFDLILTDDLKAIEFSLKELKNEKLIACRHFSSVEELRQLKKKLQEKFGEKVKVCHLIENAGEKEANEFKGKADFLALLAGTQKANAFALNKNIKIILNPVNESRIEVDEGLMTNYALQNKILITAFSFFCEKNDFQKTLMLKNLMLLGKLAKRTKTIALTASGARSSNELRKQKELLCFSSLYLKEPETAAEKAFKELFGEKEKVKVID